MVFQKSLFWALSAMIGLAFSDAESPWHQLRKLKHANFYDIQRAFEAEKAGEEVAESRDLTRVLMPNLELFEADADEDFQFKRWASFVEPRVAPSGDLSLLDIGLAEALKVMPLNGAAHPALAGQWEPLGPQASGTAGAGRLNWIEFHPTDDNTFMVGSPGGGLWMTHDGGATWSTNTDKIALLGAAWAVYHPTTPNTIFLGTGDGDHSDTKSVGVLKTTDGGATWNTTGLTYPVTGNTQIEKLLIDPRNGNNLVVATSGGVQVSNDGGATFHAATGITGKVWDLEIHPTNSSIIYASTTRFYVSTNGGNSFTAIASAGTAGSRMQLAVTAANPNYVYALLGAQNSTQGVYRSTDAGQNFTLTGSGATIGCNQTWYDYGFGANPTNANELAAGCLNVFKSTDGGANWASAGSGPHVDVHGTLYRKDGILFTVSDGGVWKNTSGTTWANLNNNLNIGQSYRLGVMPNDYDQVCTGRQDNGTDIRVGAAAYKRAMGGDGFECFWNSTGTRWYGETQNGGFSGCNYANGATSGCAGVSPSASGIWDTPWGADPSNATTVYAGRAGNIWKSTANGTNWAQIGTVGGSGSVSNFAVASANNIYVVKGGGLFGTTDGGNTWTSIKGTISGTVKNVAVSTSNPNDVWAAVSGYTATSKVWHSTNGGTSWTNETLAGLPNVPANAVAGDNGGQNGVYVGTDVGVYFKRDGMTTWQDFSDGLPRAIVTELEIVRKGTSTTDRRILAATFGRGTWRSTLFDNPISIKAGTKLPELRRFSASAFGSKVSMRFQLGGDRFDHGVSTVQLTKMDGRILYEETVPNFGVYDRSVDVSRHGKGVYLFVLKNEHDRVARSLAVN